MFNHYDRASLKLFMLIRYTYLLNPLYLIEIFIPPTILQMANCVYQLLLYLNTIASIFRRLISLFSFPSPPSPILSPSISLLYKIVKGRYSYKIPSLVYMWFKGKTIYYDVTILLSFVNYFAVFIIFLWITQTYCNFSWFYKIIY